MRPLALLSLLMLMTSTANAEILISNSSSVRSSTSASASTGGNVVGPGGIIETGESRASASSKTTTSGQGSIVETRVESVADGFRNVEESQKVISNGEPVTVIAATTSKSGSKTIRGESESSQSESATPADRVPETSDPVVLEAPSLIARISAFVNGLFSGLRSLAWWR